MERKVSFKYDPSVAGPNKEREKEISKAIAGFCNTDGGILFIGVDTDGSVVGLKKDYPLVKNLFLIREYIVEGVCVVWFQFVI